MNQQDDVEKVENQVVPIIDKAGSKISTRFNVPKNFERSPANPNSFAAYLRNLPLKPDGSLVTYYNGEQKQNISVYDAVVDLPIGLKDLHQCADAVMRLRAEFLWNQKRYDEIHFNFTNGFKVEYKEWMKGRRMVVSGNTSYWNQRVQASNSYEDLWDYLELIFTYAGTLSLSREMRSIPVDSLDIGDVFIQGGSPGHAVIVVDKAIHKTTNDIIFLLAQSYMPAQEIQVLKNPSDKTNPWYDLNSLPNIQTPEWLFTSTDLKRF